MSAGLAGIYMSFLQLHASKGAKRAQVVFPSGFYLYAALVILLLVVRGNTCVRAAGCEGRKNGDA
jgi:hypothetical protein